MRVLGMSAEAELNHLVAEALREGELDAETLQGLASQLVWRVGRSSDEGPVVVRVGFATSAALFADLPRLKNATDQELEAAAKEGSLRVEWVGQRST